MLSFIQYKTLQLKNSVTHFLDLFALNKLFQGKKRKSKPFILILGNPQDYVNFCKSHFILEK